MMVLVDLEGMPEKRPEFIIDFTPAFSFSLAYKRLMRPKGMSFWGNCRKKRRR